MFKSDSSEWIKSIFKVKSSVVLLVLKRSSYFALVGLLVSTLYFLKLPVAQPILINLIPSVVLALLLVFRTNTSYERFWEARKLWTTTSTIITNLTWQIWNAIDDKTVQDREKKIKTLYLLSALAIAKKLYLRKEKPNEELAKWLSVEQYIKLKNVRNFPLEITNWIAEYLQNKCKEGKLHVNQLTSILHTMQEYQSSLNGCIRILETPLPSAYSTHLRQLIVVYCLVLPFQFVRELGWFTGIFVWLVSFSLLGIEEIGSQLENPFGYNYNYLPLDKICHTIEKNVEEFIQNQS